MALQLKIGAYTTYDTPDFYDINGLLGTVENYTVADDGAVNPKCLIAPTRVNLNTFTTNIDEFSISFYLKVSADASTDYFVNLCNGVKISSNHIVNRTDTAPITPTLEKWHHYAITVKNREFKIYIDGALFYKKTYSSNIFYNALSNLLTYSRILLGTGIKLDDFRIYNHAFLQEEVDNLALFPVLITGSYYGDSFENGFNTEKQYEIQGKLINVGTTGGESWRALNGTDQYFRTDTKHCCKIKDEITVNAWGRLDNWVEYAETSMRLFSCTEDGGWNLKSSEYNANGRFVISLRLSDGYNFLNSIAKCSELQSGWHMFTFSYSKHSQKLKFYIDGILNNEMTTSVASPIVYNSNNHILFGAEAGGGSIGDGSYFKGDIGEIRIYGSELSPAVIKSFYTNEGKVTLQKDGLIKSKGFYGLTVNRTSILKGGFVLSKYFNRPSKRARYIRVTRLSGDNKASYYDNLTVTISYFNGSNTNETTVQSFSNTPHTSDGFTLDLGYERDLASITIPYAQSSYVIYYRHKIEISTDNVNWEIICEDNLSYYVFLGGTYKVTLKQDSISLSPNLIAKNVILADCERIYLNDPNFWQVGSVAQTSAQGRTYPQVYYTSSTRIRTNDLIKTDGNLHLKCADGYDMFILFFDENKLYYGGNNNGYVGWVKDYVMTNNAPYISVTIRKSDNSTANTNFALESCLRIMKI